MAPAAIVTLTHVVCDVLAYEFAGRDMFVHVAPLSEERINTWSLAPPESAPTVPAYAIPWLSKAIDETGEFTAFVQVMPASLEVNSPSAEPAKTRLELVGSTATAQTG